MLVLILDSDVSVCIWWIGVGWGEYKNPVCWSQGPSTQERRRQQPSLALESWFPEGEAFEAGLVVSLT